MMDNQLNWQRYLLLIRYHWKFLGISAISGLLLGLLVNALFIHPTYTSHAKLLIKGGKTPTFVTTQAGQDSEVRALTTNGNPLLTQIEVLNSSELARKVIADMKNDLPAEDFNRLAKRYPDFFEPDLLAKKLKLKNPASTDIITLNLSTPERRFSRSMVDRYVSSYQDFLADINRKALTQHGQYINEQIQATESKLQQVRRQLAEFRKNNQIVDLPNEAQSSVQQLAELETQQLNVASQVSAKQAAVNNMRRLLGTSSRQGIRSVAMGMDQAVSDTDRQLREAMHEYQTLAVKYTDEVPAMQTLKSRIASLQQQLNSETRRTLGVAAAGRGLRISDPVRSNLVNALAAAESDLQGLRAQNARLAGSVSAIKSRSLQMPGKQFQIAELMDSEKTLADVAGMLRLRAAEASFQASDNLSNVVVVQPATQARKADFPAPKHVLLLMTLAGLLGGMAWLMAMEWLKMQALQPIRSHMRQRDRERETYFAT